MAKFFSLLLALYIFTSLPPSTGEKIATSWGKIHYAKNGIHIVPTEPKNMLY